MRAFIDTNVLLDVLALREPFYADAASVWTLAEQHKVKGLVSVLSFCNIHYIVRRMESRQQADRAVTLLCDVFTPVALDGQILNQALAAKFKDFEDAVQYHSALHAGADCLVTRNPGHFPRGGLSVASPAEFLAAHAAEQP